MTILPAPILAVLLTAALGAGEVPALLQPAAGAAILRGTERLGFPTAAAAVAAAQSGDIVLLAPGTHRGPLLVERSGITLRGEPGARIDGNRQDWIPVWTPEPSCGPDAYASPIPFEPVTMSIDDRVMIDADAERGGLALHALGVGRAGRGALGTIFTYQKELQRVVISFAGADDPARHRIAASAVKSSAVTIRGADDCIIEGLVVTGGRDGILVEGSRGSTVRRCLVYACDVGIRMGAGATACRIIGNDVSMHPDAINVNCDLDSGLAGDDVWGAHKNFGTYDKTGIVADCTGPDNEIAGNYLYDVWDGIHNGNGVGKSGVRRHHEEEVLTGKADANRGLRVHHNRIDLAMDDALSCGNDLKDNSWHSNVVSRARCAVRFHTPTMGPFRFFDNTLFANGDGLRLYKTMPPAATVLIHNNLVIHPDGVIYHNVGSVEWDDAWLGTRLRRGTPGVRIYSNIFVSERQFTSQGNAAAPDYAADHNLFTCARSGDPALQDKDAHSLFATTPRFVDPDQGDWRLQPGSPGVGAGMPFAAFTIPAALPQGWTRPEPPPIGLLGIDREATPRGPVSGLWAICDRAFGMAERRPEDLVLPPDRWLLLGQGSFVAAPAAGAQVGRIVLLRAADRATGTWKVEVLAADGTILATRSGGPPGLQRIQLDLPQARDGAVTVRVDDQAKSRWRLDDLGGALRIGMVQDRQLLLAKYDGGTYALECTPPSGSTSFAVRLAPDFDGPCSAVVVRPDATRAALDPSGVVATGGASGSFRLLATFTKRAFLALEPAGQILWLPTGQERAPLRSRWPKPIF